MLDQQKGHLEQCPGLASDIMFSYSAKTKHIFKKLLKAAHTVAAHLFAQIQPASGSMQRWLPTKELRAVLHCRWQSNHQYKKHAAIKEFGYRKNATIKAFFIRPHLTTFNLSVTWRILTAQARNQNVIIASKSTWFLS